MDLDLTPAQRDLAGAARDAFAAGATAPRTGGSLTDAVVVAVELGRAAVPSRFHTEVLARLLGWDGTEPAAVALHVAGDTASYVAHLADATVLLVRMGPGAVAETGTAALARRLQPNVSGEDWYEVTLPRGLVARPCDVDGAVARAAIVLAADAVGAARGALDAAVAHVSRRHQWGVPLGSLQAVQHRCADMLLDVTTASDAVFDAAGIVDRGAGPDGVRVAAASAKATALPRCRRVTAAAHQLAGGQGVDAAAPFHRWFRRVKAAEPALGDTRAHRETVAAWLLDSPAS